MLYVGIISTSTSLGWFNLVKLIEHFYKSESLMLLWQSSSNLFERLTEV